MQKKTITELLQEAKALKQKEIELKAQMKEQKRIIATEYVDGMPEAEKAKQIAEAEGILNNAKQSALKAKTIFKASMSKIREEVHLAKEILEFVNYKQTSSLPKSKNSFVFEGNSLRFNREGIKEIIIDVSKVTWQQDFKAALKLQGINGEDRVADNIIYKASIMLKANITI